MLNYNTLNTTAYNALRHQMLVNEEENGDPKEAPYRDAEGIPTIGIGFNLRVNNVRKAVLEGLRINVKNPRDSLNNREFSRGLS